jgi:very-short-patch-repair endonuclease
MLNNKTIIECDGDYWHNRPGMQESDKVRDEYLTNKDYKVFRFWEHDIKKSANDCINTIYGGQNNV